MMMSRTMAWREEERRTLLTQVWTGGVSLTAAGRGHHHHQNHHHYYDHHHHQNHHYDHHHHHPQRVSITCYRKKLSLKGLAWFVGYIIIMTIHHHPHNHHCQRVSLGLLARNYSTELQLSPPGPVTAARQQVFTVVSR